MKDNLPLSLFIYDLKSCAPFIIIGPGTISVTSTTSGSYHSMKSQLFIPLDGTSLKLIGISIVSPAFAATVSIITPNPSGICVGSGDVVGSGDSVGSG